ncbi:RRM 6 and/or ADIP domain containing protein [Asbolus verrucosus]|uniref:RRM 6 and/or ADIP domain containing protein n=1 Tax=Asbolus verrucosus TaxID=1661398 RepID=A0A482VJ47_ASBVE|nr:RRM 6 and/or ADIP domain containing protein [Asbolus verrucosus]
MAESKVDGVVDELLLGDGFSIVDSTKGDGGDHADTKKKPSVPSKTDKKTEVKKEPAKPEEKKAEKVAAKEEKVEEPPKDDPPKDDAKVNGHDAKSDALLITTEEDLDLTEKDKKSEADVKEESDKPKKESESKEKEKPDKRKQGDVWVSNITRHVKATDLKKHFSRHGKVLTAKIVTNGKSFFGYILMENSDVANKCVRSLHGSSLDGRKITVSRQRPDQRRTVTERKATVKTVKPERKVEKKPEEKKMEKIESKKDDALASAKRTEERLRREVEFLKREVARLKRYLSDEQRRMRIEQQKNRTLGRELQEAESKLRDERRKIDRERDLFEKNQRTDRVKMENDRSLIKKELEEVKKLREYLKRKLEEEQSRPVERRPRASSPYAYSSKRFRESSGGEKGSKYVEERTRTPPSPPKLSSRSKRSPVNSFAVEKERRGPSHHYNMSEREEVGRHGSSLVMPTKPSTPAAPRNIWPSFHQEVWRMPPGATTSTPFPSSQSSYPRQSEYNSTSSSSKGPSYSQQRDFSKRDHYNSSSVRKY